MIIQGLMNIVFNLVSTLLFFNIPELSPEVLSYFEQGFEYLIMGGSIIANYTPLVYLLALFGIVIAVDTAVTAYHALMWVLKKVPFLNIK